MVTAADFDEAVHLYRDVLGLLDVDAVPSPGRVVILDAGRATLELADPPHAAYIDQVEVDRTGVADCRSPAIVGAVQEDADDLREVEVAEVRRGQAEVGSPGGHERRSRR